MDISINVEVDCGSLYKLNEIRTVPKQAEGDIFCVGSGVFTCHRLHVGVTGQPLGVSFYLLPCLKQGLFCCLSLSMLG